MNTQKIKAGDGNVKDAVMDIEGIANIDIGATEVDVSEIIIKGMPKGRKILLGHPVWKFQCYSTLERHQKLQNVADFPGCQKCVEIQLPREVGLGRKKQPWETFLHGFSPYNSQSEKDKNENFSFWSLLE